MRPSRTSPALAALTVLGACAAGVDARNTCADDSACLAGFGCDLATHTCVRSCTTAGGCLDSERCDIPYGQSQGVCSPDTYCLDDTHCPASSVCTTEAPRVCLRGCSGGAECLDSERCDIPAGAASGVCRPRPYCANDEHCGGLACDPLTHLCRGRCTTTADCTSTEACDTAAGICRLVVLCDPGDATCGTLATCDLPAGAGQGVCIPK